MRSTGHRWSVEVALPMLMTAAGLACGKGEAERPAHQIHLERWDGAGIPVVGDIDVVVRGFDDESDLTQATGTVEVVCDPCAIEEHRIAPPPARSARAAAFMGDGLGFPRVDLGMVRGELRVNGGRAEIEGRAAGGPALEVTLRGTITLAPRMADSEADIHLVLRPTADIATTAPTLSNMFLLMGGPDATGAFPVHMRGPLGRLRAVR